MGNYKYVVITPAHNEAAMMPRVIDSMAAQSVLPYKWVIVDDRSSDETWPILKYAAEKYHFITPVKVTGTEGRRVGANVVNIFNFGYGQAPDGMDLIVKMDADVLLPSDYFAIISGRFQDDPRLGMASGKTFLQDKTGWVLERQPDTHVTGACKTYRMSCFRDIGGLIPILGWDILDEVMARSKGWKAQSYRDLSIYHLRRTGSAKGMIRGRLRTGKVYYKIRSNPLFVLAKSLYRAIEPPYFSGLIIPFGFVIAALEREKRLDDSDLARYLRREQLNRLLGRTLHHEEWTPRSMKNDRDLEKNTAVAPHSLDVTGVQNIGA